MEHLKKVHTLLKKRSTSSNKNSKDKNNNSNENLHTQNNKIRTNERGNGNIMISKFTMIFINDKKENEHTKIFHL